MILLKGLELKAFNPLLLRLLLHHRPHLLQWLSKLETHLHLQRHPLLATCWVKQQEARLCKDWRPQRQQQGLGQSLGQKVDLQV